MVIRLYREVERPTQLIIKRPLQLKFMLVIGRKVGHGIPIGSMALLDGHLGYMTV